MTATMDTFPSEGAPGALPGTHEVWLLPAGAGQSPPRRRRPRRSAPGSQTVGAPSAGAGAGVGVAAPPLSRTSFRPKEMRKAMIATGRAHM